MASRRAAISKAWRDDQRADLRNLPHVARLVRPGSYGTFAERTPGSHPLAPTLDDGPLYTGEDREEVNGDYTDLPPDVPYVLLASLRRPWPLVGFALDTANSAAGVTVTAGLLAIMRSGQARLVGNVVGGPPPPVPELAITGIAAPFPWVSMSGIYAGVRVAIFAFRTGGGEPAPAGITVRANLWGYNAPGFGP